MPVTRRLPKSKGSGRRKQFGVRLKDGPAAVLIATAKTRRMRPTTLATELLEEALADGTQRRAGVEEILAELQEAMRTLSVNHINGVVKLLQLFGMTSEEITDWKKGHFKRRAQPASEAGIKSSRAREDK